MTASKRVAVIGAGSAGISAAKFLIQAGIDTTVYEAGSYIGGMWKFENDNGFSQAYKHLRIITPKNRTRFTDFDFAPDTTRFPSHVEMQAYMQSYADYFGVTPHVRFRSRVTSLKPIDGARESEPRWRLEWSGPDGEGTEEYHDVVVASGHLNVANHDPLLKSFEGEYVHSSKYRDPRPFVGKRVCVVGTGNSGIDAASDVCTVADRTVLVARSPVTIQPKVIFGVAWPDIALGLRKPWIPAKIRMRVIKWATFMAHGDQTKLGFQPPTTRTHSTMSESIVSHIQFGRVEVKPGITAIDGTKVTFADTSMEDFDVIIAATGYRVDLPFLDASIVPLEGNFVGLYKRVFAPDWPGLHFQGMLQPQVTLSRVFEAQAKTVVMLVKGDIDLPSSAEMHADIEAARDVVLHTYSHSMRHGLEDADTSYQYTMARFRREHRIRKLNDGNLPRPLKSDLAQKLYLRARRIEVPGI